MLRKGVERRGAQKPERIARIALRAEVNVEFPGAEIGEARFGGRHGNAADAAGEQARSHSLIAKFRLPGEIFEQRPAFPVIDRHAVEGAARQKQPAAIAKREMAQGSAQHQIRARQVTRHEGAIQPGERCRRNHRARQIMAGVRRIAVLDAAHERHFRRGAVRGLEPSRFCAHARVAVPHLPVGCGHQHCLVRALPEQGRFERVELDGPR